MTLAEMYRAGELTRVEWIDRKLVEFLSWLEQGAYSPTGYAQWHLVAILPDNLCSVPFILFRPNCKVAGQPIVGDFIKPEGCPFLWEVKARAIDGADRYLFVERVSGTGYWKDSFSELVHTSEYTGWMVALADPLVVQTRLTQSGILQEIQTSRSLLDQSLSVQLGRPIDSLYAPYDESIPTMEEGNEALFRVYDRISTLLEFSPGSLAPQSFDRLMTVSTEIGALLDPKSRDESVGLLTYEEARQRLPFVWDFIAELRDDARTLDVDLGKKAAIHIETVLTDLRCIHQAIARGEEPSEQSQESATLVSN